LQGELPPSARTDEVAAAGRLVTSLDPRAQLPRSATTAQAVDALLGASEGGRTITVPADRARRAVTGAELVRTLGQGRPTRVPDRLDYEVDLGAHVRFMVVDVVNRRGGQKAQTTPELLFWLRERLAAADRAGRAAVVVSHQPLPGAALAVLDDSPAVIAAIHGDTHRNRLTPRGRYWNVGTSSLADHPMQSRLFRLRRDAGGGMALETWMVDQDGRGLAGTARELAFLDAQGGRPTGKAGSRADRNARLYLPQTATG
jgi:hypothetical protein